MFTQEFFFTLYSMPQVSKTAENEKFATLIIELLNTQKDIIARLDKLDAKIEGKQDDDLSAWNRM